MKNIFNYIEDIELFFHLLIIMLFVIYNELFIFMYIQLLMDLLLVHF